MLDSNFYLYAFYYLQIDLLFFLSVPFLTFQILSNTNTFFA